jgi:hypothetical protein
MIRKNTLFLTEDEQENVRLFTQELMKKKMAEGEYIESGGLKVVVEVKPRKKGDCWIFSIYRCIGHIEIKGG